MSIVESDWPPSWFLDASETGESTKGGGGNISVGVTGAPLPKGLLYSLQFRSHQEIKMAASRTQRFTEK